MNIITSHEEKFSQPFEYKLTKEELEYILVNGFGYQIYIPSDFHISYKGIFYRIYYCPIDNDKFYKNIFYVIVYHDYSCETPCSTFYFNFEKQNDHLNDYSILFDLKEFGTLIVNNTFTKFEIKNDAIFYFKDIENAYKEKCTWFIKDMVPPFKIWQKYSKKIVYSETKENQNDITFYIFYDKTKNVIYGYCPEKLLRTESQYWKSYVDSDLDGNLIQNDDGAFLLIFKVNYFDSYILSLKTYDEKICKIEYGNKYYFEGKESLKKFREVLIPKIVNIY